MEYSLEKLVECWFLLGFNKASYILEIRHFENPKKMEVKT
jgi:hypothetical protein